MNETLMKEFDRVIWIALERLLGMGDYYNETLVRLRGGLILRNAVEEIEKRLNCKDTDNCLYFYGLSAHDVTLVALFSLFNEISQFLGEIPHIGYGANVVFELWNINGQYKIKILYANQYDEEPFPITKFAKGCDGKEEFCDISNFLNASHSLYPSDLIKECASTSREINLDSESDGKLVKRAIETDYLDEILEPLLWM
ncbi:unnamed protein product [Dracunculus medinensis]|uniref:Phosphatase n=1 Tax=Dracunculus medinensis TaxID=318479 RepID=A0A0N4UAR4_DRAME|nr:unnamed protein product [Dracunculus medinensis]